MATGTGTKAGTAKVTAAGASEHLEVEVVLTGVGVWCVRMQVMRLLLRLASAICPLNVRVVTRGGGIENWAWRSAAHLREAVHDARWYIRGTALLQELRKMDPQAYLARVLKPATGAEMPAERTLRGEVVPGNPPAPPAAHGAAELQQWRSPFEGLGDIVNLHTEGERDVATAALGDRERVVAVDNTGYADLAERFTRLVPPPTHPFIVLVPEPEYRRMQGRLHSDEFGWTWAVHRLQPGNWRVEFPTKERRGQFMAALHEPPAGFLENLARGTGNLPQSTP